MIKRNYFFYTLLTVLSLLIFCSKVFSAEKIVIFNSDVITNINGDAQFYVDVTARLKVNEILAAPFQSKFKTFPEGIPNFGNTSAAVWCRLNIENQTDDDLFLQIDNPSLDTIRLFVLNDHMKVDQLQETGSYIPFNRREIKSNNFILDLRLKPQERKTYLLRITCEAGALQASISVSPLKNYFEKTHAANIIQGLYFGFILFIVIYNLFLFIILKDPTYFYFGAFSACMGFIFALINGFTIEYLWSNAPWINRYFTLLCGSAGIFIILFTASFLKSRANTPKMHTWLLALAGMYLLVMFLTIIGEFSLAIQMVKINTITTLLFLMVIAISVWKKGFEPAKYFLFAWSFFVISFVIFLLRDAAYITVNLLTEKILQVGSTLTIITMSFALGRKISIYIEMKKEAREIALKTAIENQKLVNNQNKILEARVTEKTRDLEQSVSALQHQREALREANNFKDKVFSVIGHDLKSPLSSLNGLLDLFRKKSLTELEKDRVLENIRLALNNTRNLLDNILAWGQQHDRFIQPPSTVNLRVMVSELFELFKVQARTKNIKLLASIKENTLLVAEKNTLQFVLRNLISNAIKFTKKNGKIEVGIHQTTEDVKIFVKDTGVGIDEEGQRKLFSENKHFSTRGTQNESGTGLGLLLCKEFIEKTGGAITVESKTLEGTTFTIHLKRTPIVSSLTF